MNLFAPIDQHLDTMLKNMIVTPVEVFTQGVVALALPCVCIWGMYKCYMILAGLEADPFIPFVKEVMIKIAIFIFAGSSVYLQSMLITPLQDFGTKLASDFISITSSTGANNTGQIQADAQSIFTAIDAMLDNALKKLDPPLSEKPLSPKAQEEYDRIEKEIERYWDAEKKLAKEGKLTRQQREDIFDKVADLRVSQYVLRDKDTGRGEGIGLFDQMAGLVEAILTAVKKLIIMAGFGIFTLVAFITIFVNKVYFTLCLGVSPLFIFFLAFEKTKGWFNSWLNTTMGFCFTYPLILVVSAGLIQVFDDLNTNFPALQTHNISETTSWASVWSIFLMCLIFAYLINKIAGISSSLFSGGNVAGGNSLVFMFDKSKDLWKKINHKNKDNAGMENAGQGSAK